MGNSPRFVATAPGHSHHGDAVGAMPWTGRERSPSGKKALHTGMGLRAGPWQEQMVGTELAPNRAATFRAATRRLRRHKGWFIWKISAADRDT